ncbi:hypothetical protein [Natronobeatus ordinarius]|uniref:hypothetical protein n=1 Tax=Natronobeatus ordinarius TaxID=2963433 RepID=UPI0020CE3D07|nr:hypothetical protein [Natronobeatus ordinarius]
MGPPSLQSITAAAVGGVANVAAVLALFARFEYPVLESIGSASFVVLTAFLLGFVAVFVSAHTRLVTPAVGFVGLLVAVAVAEVTSPAPRWSELDGYTIVEGPLFVLQYSNTWYVWLSLLLFAGVVEFAFRRGYGLGDHRLRNLPDLPLSRPVVVGVVLGVGGLVALATAALTVRSGIRPPIAALAVYVVALAVAAVPLAALLARGIVSPVLLFALAIPYLLVVEVFTTTDSPVHILLFGPYAIVMIVAWALEAALRSRVGGWDGGRFSGSRAGG